MSDQNSPVAADLVVTLAILGGGIWGLTVVLGLPYRAALWPASVMILLILFTLVHLVRLLRVRHAGSNPTDE